MVLQAAKTTLKLSMIVSGNNFVLMSTSYSSVARCLAKFGIVKKWEDKHKHSASWNCHIRAITVSNFNRRTVYRVNAQSPSFQFS